MFVFFNCFDKMRFNDSIATASLYHQCNIFKLLQKQSKDIQFTKI